MKIKYYALFFLSVLIFSYGCSNPVSNTTVEKPVANNPIESFQIMSFKEGKAFNSIAVDSIVKSVPKSQLNLLADPSDLTVKSFSIDDIAYEFPVQFNGASDFRKYDGTVIPGTAFVGTTPEGKIQIYYEFENETLLIKIYQLIHSATKANTGIFNNSHWELKFEILDKVKHIRRVSEETDYFVTLDSGHIDKDSTYTDVSKSKINFLDNANAVYAVASISPFRVFNYKDSSTIQISFSLTAAGQAFHTPVIELSSNSSLPLNISLLNAEDKKIGQLVINETGDLVIQVYRNGELVNLAQ